MAKRRGDCKTRSEITEKTERSESDMREKEGDMEKVVEDVETVRGTLESLDLGGTVEGNDSVEAAIEGAESTTENIFDGEDTNLEQIQSDSEEHEGEVQEKSNSDSADLDKVSDAKSRINTGETIGELDKAEQDCQEDIEFLDDIIRDAEEAREQSENTQKEYQSRVHSKGR